MAITHFTPQLISRGSGRSAVLSAAYRHCARMEHQAEGRTVDYSAKRGLRHEEFLLPPDAPEWAKAMIADRSVAGAAEAFWNAVEAFEKRSDAQLAKEFIIALPVELDVDRNIALVKEFVATQVLARGQVADWVFHDEPGNPHIHLMTTLRPLGEDGFGPKKVPVIGQDGAILRNDAGKIAYRLWSGDKADFLEQREGWLALQNKHLALAGLDIRVDGRSYAERGIDLVPTTHIGVATKAIDRKSKTAGTPPDLERIALFKERKAENRERILRRPEIVLDVVTREMSVFTERDIAKVLHRYVDDAATFQDLMARILQDPKVLRLEREHIALASGAREPAKYTTHELIALEAGMARQAIWLAGRSSHGVRKPVLSAAFERHSRLSNEQRHAVAHVAGKARIAAVVGRAGAGKTTMMKAAREVWEAAGYRVVGAALAGKAAEGLEKEAGIASRTLASWELAWSKGRDQLDDKTVFVLDEAGMVSSRQMALFVETVTKAGAKLVLVGDPDQLQPIEAGAAFRAIADRIGYAELETVYRQREQWMRDASLDLARGNVARALDAYEDAGMVRTEWTRAEAIGALIEDWNRDYDPAKSSLILAHRRRDVRELNQMARAKLVERDLVGKGFAFRTEDGIRQFAAGDRIVFLKNEGSLGVKNGMLANVIEAAAGRIVTEIGEGESRRRVTVEQHLYANVDHGYATTVHKSQGATVDRVKVLASSTLDRHLTYVAMTRHRETAELYVGMAEFANRASGVLVDHGEAPFENKPENRDSYFVTLSYREGEQRTIWGVDLARAMKEADPEIGDRIGLEHKGAQTVTLPDGTAAKRNSWQVVPIRDLAMRRLSERLSRDGSKETTLDYERASSYRAALRFSETRGLHLMRVARTLVADKVRWTARQKQKLADLGARLAAVGARFGLGARPKQAAPNIAMSNIVREAKPMVAGITTFAKSIGQIIEDKLVADPALKKQWEEVSTRFRLVFSDPESSFRKVDVDAMLKDRQAAATTLSKLSEKPDSFGALKGKTGLLASRADKQERELAGKNAQALARDLERYLRLRNEAEHRYEAEERATRLKVAVDIPALSPSAKQTLERIRDAIDRNDLPSALEFALEDKMVEAELEGFARAVSERFGERSLTGIAAREADGEAFKTLSDGMNAAQKEDLKAAWPDLRTAQQLAAQQRTAAALKEAETVRQTQTKGLTLQ
ncbi:Ti-type conjugative transfer relaxase TraA [Chelatococcus asaccharovorans]|uniref:Ti-type conjugative transfer relaxase TraA n=1 Tax=Chelatococcus asaccharovorans TaxID=28210 RepID=A0A2V3TT26_9HYPH|nr:Ti-type conjugative transfer relaxase TraA [Chelatococcus asaccharovorans]MBS7707884.1 Ti-type conjugative transfer relaxase TraA [Chelatococcus asaccharovorans]PXW51133.1 Ti-type conjugative transfer relaxase TraA [Chelatococcus asaccharovorans]